MIVAVLPERYRAQHAPTSYVCWCKPKVEIVENTPLIVHNNARGDADTGWVVVRYHVHVPVGNA